jgi:hypothetical protein
MSSAPTSHLPTLSFCPSLLGALLLACSGFACAAAPPAASPSSSAPVAGEQGQQEALYPGTPEYGAFLEEIRQDIARSRAQIEPILQDGDIAQLTIEGSKLSVERIDQARASRVALILERDDPKDEVGARWFRRSAGPGRIMVLMGEGTLLFNIDDTGISLEPDSLSDDG